MNLRKTLRKLWTWRRPTIEEQDSAIKDAKNEAYSRAYGIAKDELEKQYQDERVHLAMSWAKAIIPVRSWPVVVRLTCEPHYYTTDTFIEIGPEDFGVYRAVLDRKVVPSNAQWVADEILFAWMRDMRPRLVRLLVDKCGCRNG